MELIATHLNRLEFILEEKIMKILTVQTWRTGNNNNSMEKLEWEAAEFDSRECNDGTIILTVEDLEENSCYDVRVLCEADKGKIMFSTKNQLHTEGK